MLRLTKIVLSLSIAFSAASAFTGLPISEVEEPTVAQTPVDKVILAKAYALLAEIEKTDLIEKDSKESYEVKIQKMNGGGSGYNVFITNGETSSVITCGTSSGSEADPSVSDNEGGICSLKPAGN
jgi:hypothetical protein